MFKAANLALSRLSSLPTNNSAESSSSIEDSNCKIEPAIASTLDSSIPNALATVTASAIAFPLWPKDNVVAAETLEISFIISLSFKTTPFLSEEILAWAKTSPVMASISLPVVAESLNMPANSSLVKPAASRNLVIVINCSSVSITEVPNSLLIAIWVSATLALVTNILLDLLATRVISNCKFWASP